MKLMRKLFVAGFCAASSLGMMAFPVNAMAMELQEVVQADAVFQKAKSLSPIEQNQEEPETVDRQPDDTQEVLPVSPVQEDRTQNDRPVVDDENNQPAAEAAENQARQIENAEEPAGVEEVIEGEMEAKDAENAPLLSVTPEYEPLESISEQIESKARIVVEEELEEVAEAVEDGTIYFDLQPNFDDLTIWQNEQSPYHKNRLWGQCTWFSWHRFYEIYGFNPGFRGNGYEVAGQLVASHPDKFELSTTPVAGAVFSYMNHTGIVVDVAEDGTLTIQDGNYDFVTNHDWNQAISDWNTFTVSLSDFMARGGVTFANPKDIKVQVRK